MRSLCRTGVALLVVLAAISAECAWGADRSGKYPGWLRQDEATPFFPDDAFVIRPNVDDEVVKDGYFRKSFTVRRQPRRAEVATVGWSVAAVVLNGRLVMEAVRVLPTDGQPKFTDVTSEVHEGRNTLELRAHSRTQWPIIAYAQLRLEYPDGQFEDIVTDGSWQWHRAPTEAWPRGDSPSEGWRPVEVLNDYYGTQGDGGWFSKQFALMPREMLLERMKKFNDAMDASWPVDREAPRSGFDGAYEKAEYAARFEDFLRIDPETGQVVDATGKVRHLFFTIYNQKEETKLLLGVLSAFDPEFDFDRLEDDLDLMEAAYVHPYMRSLSWRHFLDENGGWQRCRMQPKGTNLPEFTYNYEVFDYFLDRCQAHGRFVVFHIDFFWGSHWDTLPAPYHAYFHLYPEVAEASALAYRKILSRYSERTCMAGYMVGEEGIRLPHDLDNGHMRAAFIDYVRDRYGSLDNLRRTWRRGYDFADPSEWQKDDCRATYWAEKADANPMDEAYPPVYPLKEDLWSGLTDWSELHLPVLPQRRLAQPPHAGLSSHRGNRGFTPFDPVWIDYNAFREDVLYLNMVNRWVEVVREAVRGQWLFHSNATDYTSHWHMHHFFRRAELAYDVIGVGSHDAYYNLSELPPWQRMRKYYKVVASYRPYVRAPESRAIGIATGEGAGGRPGQEEEILNYYRGTNFDLVGHGAAFEQSYTWQHLSGANADPAGRSRLTKVLRWMAEFHSDVDGVAFSLPRDVPILVVRNNNLQRSNMSGRDFGNVLPLADSLGQLNVEFDIVMDKDLVIGRQPRKINVSDYRVIFLPSIDCDYSEDLWATLDAWLSDERFTGKRALVAGLVGKLTPYLAPTRQFHPVLAGWLGATDYTASVHMEGQNEFLWQPLAGDSAAGKIQLDFGNRSVSATGVFGDGKPLLLTSDRKVVAISTTYKGNSIFAFGFPLGLAFDLHWEVYVPQEPYDVMASVYEDLLDAVEIPRPVRAPHNVRVAVSDDRSVIMIRERFGIETTDLCTLKLPEGAVYKGCRLVPQDDGRMLIQAKLPPYGGLCFKRIE